jgi:hypothetical protein
MASKIQFKRGTTTQSDAYRGAEGEVIINTTKDTIVVHDGVETGGYEIIRADLSNISGNVPAVNITDVDCGIYGSGLFTPASLSTSLSQTLDNPNPYSTSAGDRFGQVVAMTDTYSIVAATGEDDSGGPSSGKAYIYNNSTGALVHTLNNPNPYGTSQYDSFGGSVAISDNYAIVSASGEDEAGGLNSGKAYIYNNSTGALVHTLTNPNAYGTSVGDRFGAYVGITDTYAIVSAWEADAGGSNSGKAYIYNVSTGALLHTLDNPNPYDTSAGDNFGWSVAITDTYAIVGTPSEDGASGYGAGKAYIYNNSTGALLYTLDNPNDYGTSTGDQFGMNVAISGNYAIVGAPYEDDAGGTSSGKAYIFNNSTGALVHTLDNPNAYGTSQDDSFGSIVGISGNYAIVGAYGEGDAGGTQSGKAYIFSVSTGALLKTLDNPNDYGTSQSDLFGRAVAISDNYAIVGSQEDEAGGTDSGKAYIYTVTEVPSYEITAPGAPIIGLASVVDHETATVVYTAPAEDGHATIETYTATSSPGGITGTLSQAGSGTITVTGLTENTSYTFTVTATNSYTTGDPSSASNTVTTPATPVAIFSRTIDNPNSDGTSANDNFGGNVVTTDNYMIVSATESGAVYMFDPSDGSLLRTISNPDGFDGVLALSDDYAVIGSPAYSSWVGRIHVFTASTGVFARTISSPHSQNYRFGQVVSLSGDYLLVGVERVPDGSNIFSGKAYIYNVTTGALVHTLSNPNDYGTSTRDNFGRSAAISGNYAIVGAQFEDDAGGTSSGKAYIYNVSTGALLHTLDNPNDYGTSASDDFSYAVAISGNYAIVSAPSEDDAGGDSSGKVYIFNVSTGALLHTLDNPNPYGTSTGDQFGEVVGISGNYAIVGSQFEDDAGGTSSGKAYIFNVSTGALLQTIDNPNAYGTSADDNFAKSVAISGNYAIVGAYDEDDAGGTGSGKVYVYTV